MNNSVKIIRRYFRQCLAVIFLLSLQFGHTQTTTQQVKSLRVVMRLAPSDTTMQPGDTTFKTTTHLSGKAFVLLFDTSGILKVHLKLGVTEGSSSLLNKTFVFNQQGTFTDGTSFSRTGRMVKIGLGNFTGLNTYYCEVHLENSQNQMSGVVKFKNRP